jgi:hypothetical protein
MGQPNNPKILASLLLRVIRYCDTIFLMANSMETILELRLEPEGLGGIITCPAAMRPAAGQYLAASSLDGCEALPVILYPTSYRRGDLSVAAPLPSHWKVGMRLNIRGPLGKGFQMPITARRIAIASLTGQPARLLPLAYQALDQKAAVTVYAAAPPADLPPEVEILPIDLLPEAHQWADFLALECNVSAIGGLRSRLGLGVHQRLECPAQLLVLSQMPCMGLAECGICDVLTRTGWSHTCVDGPVYPFHQLELSD